jgi:hypothetical protein
MFIACSCKCVAAAADCEDDFWWLLSFVTFNTCHLLERHICWDPLCGKWTEIAVDLKLELTCYYLVVNLERQLKWWGLLGGGHRVSNSTVLRSLYWLRSEWDDMPYGKTWTAFVGLTFAECKAASAGHFICFLHVLSAVFVTYFVVVPSLLFFFLRTVFGL